MIMHHKFSVQFRDELYNKHKYRKYEAANIFLRAVQISANSISNLQKLINLKIDGNKQLMPKDFNIDDEIRALEKFFFSWLYICSAPFLAGEAYNPYSSTVNVYAEDQEIQVSHLSICCSNKFSDYFN